MAQDFVILMIDDNLDHLELLKEFAEDLETDFGILKIESFTDEQKGIEYFKKYRDKVNVILLDYTLPQIGGIKVVKILRELDKNVPIIGLTGHSEDTLIGNETVADQFLKAGANGCITKSIDNYIKIDEILHKILEKNQEL